MNSSQIGENKLAVVTGASKGIGLAISKMLIHLGYTVIGCARFPEVCDYQHSKFRLDKINLLDAKQIDKWVNNLKNEGELSLLVNNAGKGYFSPMEEFSWEQIQTMIFFHITAPMLLTNSLLRQLKNNEGRIIFIGSIAGTKVSPWGSVYGATKAGLLHFGRELFQELRKSGVKVTNIIPDMTQTDFYQDLNFATDDDSKSYILSECIASAIEGVLTQREGTIISEIQIQPERFKLKKIKKNSDI